MRGAPGDGCPYRDCGATWAEVANPLNYSVPALSLANTVSFDPADGTFSFAVDASGYNNNLSISVSADDMNSRSSTTTVTLLGDSVGPTVTIATPIPNSRYESAVTVTGTVRDRDSTAEVASLAYSILGTSDGGAVTFDSVTGAYSFTFDTTSYTDNVVVEVSSIDLNDRSTSSQITLLPYLTGPELSITSPINVPYGEWEKIPRL